MREVTIRITIRADLDSKDKLVLRGLLRSLNVVHFRTKPAGLGEEILDTNTLGDIWRHQKRRGVLVPISQPLPVASQAAAPQAEQQHPKFAAVPEEPKQPAASQPVVIAGPRLGNPRCSSCSYQGGYWVCNPASPICHHRVGGNLHRLPEQPTRVHYTHYGSRYEPPQKPTAVALQKFMPPRPHFRILKAVEQRMPLPKRALPGMIEEVDDGGMDTQS